MELKNRERNNLFFKKQHYWFFFKKQINLSFSLPLSLIPIFKVIFISANFFFFSTSFYFRRKVNFLFIIFKPLYQFRLGLFKNITILNNPRFFFFFEYFYKFLLIFHKFFYIFKNFFILKKQLLSLCSVFFFLINKLIYYFLTCFSSLFFTMKLSVIPFLPFFLKLGVNNRPLFFKFHFFFFFFFFYKFLYNFFFVLVFLYFRYVIREIYIYISFPQKQRSLFFRFLMFPFSSFLPYQNLINFEVKRLPIISSPSKKPFFASFLNPYSFFLFKKKSFFLNKKRSALKKKYISFLFKRFFNLYEKFFFSQEISFFFFFYESPIFLSGFNFFDNLFVFTNFYFSKMIKLFFFFNYLDLFPVTPISVSFIILNRKSKLYLNWFSDFFKKPLLSKNFSSFLGFFFIFKSLLFFCFRHFCLVSVFLRKFGPIFHRFLFLVYGTFLLKISCLNSSLNLLNYNSFPMCFSFLVKPIRYFFNSLMFSLYNYIFYKINIILLFHVKNLATFYGHNIVDDLFFRDQIYNNILINVFDDSKIVFKKKNLTLFAQRFAQRTLTFIARRVFIRDYFFILKKKSNSSKLALKKLSSGKLSRASSFLRKANKICFSYVYGACFGCLQENLSEVITFALFFLVLCTKVYSFFLFFELPLSNRLLNINKNFLLHFFNTFHSERKPITYPSAFDFRVLKFFRLYYQKVKKKVKVKSKTDKLLKEKVSLSTLREESNLLKFLWSSSIERSVSSSDIGKLFFSFMFLRKILKGKKKKLFTHLNLFTQEKSLNIKELNSLF